MPQRFGMVALTVFLLSFCGLALEVAMTRIFAVVLRYHFAFFAIALALCGLGLGGYASHWLKSWANSRSLLLWFVVGFPLTTLFTLWFLIAVLLPSYPNAFWLAGIVTLLPFFCLGGAMALLFDRFSEVSGRLYASDLAGAAMAAVGVVLLLNLFGGLNAAIFLAGVAFVAIVFVAANATLIRLAVFVFGFICFAFVVVNHAKRIFDLPPVRHAHPEVTKPMLRDLATGKSHIKMTVWNAFCRTDAVVDEGEPNLMHLYTDGEVPALMVRLKKGNLNDGAWLMDSLMGVPYALLTFPKTPKQPPRKINSVLALGSGGGVDVICALIVGAKRVDAVDVNPAMKIITDHYREFNSGIYYKQGVHFYIAEARSFVKQTKRHYDLVVMALTQTATMGKAGLALVESFVHTKEASDDYWRVLSERGMVALITQEPFLAMRWWLTCLETVQKQTGKQPNEAALHLGWWTIPPELFAGIPYRHLVVMARQPFQESDALLLRQVTELWKIVPIAVPFVHVHEPMSGVLQGDLDADDVVADTLWRHGAYVRPVTDDAPFFVDLSPTVPPMLWQFVIFAIVLVAVFGLLVWLQSRRSLISNPQPLANFWLPTGYVALLGIGFMLVEIGMLQRTMLLLGSPTHTVALFVGALLLGGATGSFLTQRTPTERLPEWAMNACIVVAALTAVLGLVIGGVVNSLHALPLLLRSALLFALAFGVGVPMGMPFPSAMRLVPVAWTVTVAYLWGVNGVMSVVGSVSAVMLGKSTGYSKAIIIGAACYLLAAAIMRSFRQRNE